MIRATDMAHLVLSQHLKPGDWVVDATVGNGHDTLFLSECVGVGGRVFGFDVQLQALRKAGTLLEGVPQVTWIHEGHETMALHLPESARGRVAAVMFNLGYLPGGDKTIITKAETTIAGLSQSLDILTEGGLVTMVLYCGHDGGGEEAKAVRDYARSLPRGYRVAHYERLNSVGDAAPSLLLIERR